jgi:predicted TPR repeat methyltransferase
MPNYGDPKYWEDRYNEQKDVTFDWLEDYEALKPIIEDFKLRKDAKIINLGCGNSEFCENMYDDGFQDIENIDICENVIENMRERNKHREKMSCNFSL